MGARRSGRLAGWLDLRCVRPFLKNSHSPEAQMRLPMSKPGERESSAKK